MTTEQKVTRKLRAIMSADVKGYSILMADDEVVTVQTLKDYRNIMSASIEEHSGRVVDAVGDNLLAEFDSAVDAVQCAVEVQKQLKSKNQELPENKRLEFRIGVNIGDVIQDGDSIFGDGVNIAARIEKLADAGGVCVSRNVYDHIKKKLSLGFEFLGEHPVKNISEPVTVYKVLMDERDAGKLIGLEKKASKKGWYWAAAAAVIVAVAGLGIWQFYLQRPIVEPASVEKMAYPLPDKPSIAVLPFDNMTGDPKQEFFSDGLSEEIITALASVPEFFVIARNSTFTYKGKPVKMQQISEDLGVQYVLEGSVRKSGEKVRITAQLIDAIKGHHLWAETYDRNIEDLFAVQEEITVKVITELREKVTGSAQIRFAEPCSVNLEAYLKYLKANKHFYRFNKADNDIARRLAEEAIALDAEYACAYSLLGGIHRMDVDLGAADNPERSLKIAKEMVDKAIDLNPSIAGPHSALAHIYQTMGQYDRAIETAEKAIALGPNNRLANGAMGMTLMYAGRPEEAIPFLKKAIRHDPFSSVYFVPLGFSYFLNRQHDDAIRACKPVADKTKSFHSFICLAAAYSEAGREQEAGATAAEILKLNPKFSLEQHSKLFEFKNPADKELVLSSLRKAGLPDKPPLPIPDKPSIAVLAFDNLSGDPEQKYFNDGISEEIINALSKTDQLFVIARNSSFVYKGKPVNVKQVSRELGVRYVLEGSVRKSEDRIRITAQLIDATTGHHLWSERYDRELKDIFALQDEITMKIVTSLQVKLTEGEQARMMAKGYETLDVFLKALEMYSLWRDGTMESLMRHGQIAKEVIDMAPELSVGYRSLGWHHWFLAIVGKSPKENLNKAFVFAQKAISLDESDALSHSLLGGVYQRMKQFEKAIAAGERAIKLDPNGAQVHLGLGQTLTFAGRPDEAMPHLKQAIRLNPFPPYLYFSNLGRCYLLQGQYEEALTAFKKAVQLAPKSPPLHLNLAVIYILLDREQEARASAEKALELFPNFSVTFVSKTSRYKNPAHTKLIVDAMRKAGFPEGS